MFICCNKCRCTGGVCSERIAGGRTRGSPRERGCVKRPGETNATDVHERPGGSRLRVSPAAEGTAPAMPSVAVPGAHLSYLATPNASSDATPVVFIHGFCQSSAFWAPTLRLLPKSHRGFAVDLTGFGSSRASKATAYSMEELADHVIAFADAVSLDRFVLCGNSMGGVVCQSLATRFPGRLLKLVLVATGAFPGNPAANLEKADMMETMAWERDWFEASVKAFFAEGNAPADWNSALVPIAMGAVREAMVGATRSSALHNFLLADREIVCPTLIVQGELDTARTPVDGGRLNGAIAGSE